MEGEIKNKAEDQIGDTPTPDIVSLNQEILRTNKEMLESLNYIRNHFRFQLVVTAIKWFFIAALIIFGFISLGSIMSGFSESYLTAISGQ